MLIYNFQKEFLGIDEEDLQALGLRNLAELMEEVTDFSDLFVKTPGNINNFKHVHWIDYILCGESNEEAKVIINIRNRNYKCILNVTSSTYLIDNPYEKAYFIKLNRLSELSDSESKKISGDIVDRVAPEFDDMPKKVLVSTQTEEPPKYVEKVETNSEENFVEDTPLEISFEEEVPLEVTIEKEVPLQINIEEEAPLEINIEEEIKVTTTVVKEKFDNGYIYDPTIASEELGLPLDLIEEFIEDFIQQAKDFKESIYESVNTNDLDNIKVLSHKLKGVAANLRIEDALEVLETVNISNEIDEITENLNTFYKIISKLSGEEISTEVPSVESPSEEAPLEISLEEEAPLEISLEEEAPLEISLEEEAPLEISLEEEAPLEISLEEEAPSVEYSKESVSDEIGMDIDSFNELFEDYLDEANIISNEIENSIDSEEFSSLKNNALKLKGMSDNMRINSFSNELEIIMKSTQKEELETAIAKVKSAISQISKLGE